MGGTFQADFLFPHAVILSRILGYSLISRDNKQELASLYLLFLILILTICVNLYTCEVRGQPLPQKKPTIFSF